MLNRTLAPIIKNLSKGFPVLLLTGPRQIGKSTLLESLAEANRKYISLDNLDIRNLAKTNPALFIQTYPPPIIIDEVQYAPELFSYIKIYVDTHKEDGLFWLTGSQKFHLMKGVQETLAGRIVIIDMLGLSQKEISKTPKDNIPFLPTKEWLSKVKHVKEKNIFEVYKKILNGSFPKVLTNTHTDRKAFYRSYIQTYIERDVKDSYNIADNIKFFNFIRAVAARTGNLLNYNDIGRDATIDTRTAKLWLSILERSGLIKILEPYHTNVTSRIIKAPKVYFLDTGLCAYLTSWDSPESLEAGAMNGAIFETYAFIEILKSYWHNGEEPNIYFYRDNDQKEIDFIIEKNGTLYPIEVKKTANPSSTDIKNFKVLKKLNKSIGEGAIISLYPTIIPINEEIVSIPIWDI